MSDDRTLSELMDSVEEHQKECINCGIPDHGLYNPNYEPDCPWCKLAGTGKFAKPTREDKSKELNAKVNELLNKGMGYHEISQELHCSYDRISSVKKLQVGPRRKDIDRAKKDVKIGVMLLEGKGYEEISRELHCSYGRIHQVKNKQNKKNELKQETKPDWFGYEK